MCVCEELSMPNVRSLSLSNLTLKQKASNLLLHFEYRRTEDLRYGMLLLLFTVARSRSAEKSPSEECGTKCNTLYYMLLLYGCYLDAGDVILVH